MLSAVLRKVVLPACLLAASLFPGVPRVSVAFADASVVSAVPVGEEVASLAAAYVGTPYVWGGASPRGFDCTGFVMWVYGQFGFGMPRTEAGQLASGPRVGPDELAPGDVLVFANTYRAGLSHTGIYLGNGRFIHAATERTGVVVSTLWDSYWGPRFVGASRPLG